MNSGVTSERVYDALKRRILDHAVRPGERLDPARLGEELNSSTTPVRDALHVLTGQGLVETGTSEGFHVMAVDVPALQDLYEWNAQVLILAVRGRPTRSLQIEAASPIDRVPAAAAAELFWRIAAESVNAEHRRTVASLNDRLHAARLCETSVLPDIVNEIEELSTVIGQADPAALRRVILAYHRRRHRAASAIIRALYRQP